MIELNIIFTKHGIIANAPRLSQLYAVQMQMKPSYVFVLAYDIYAETEYNKAVIEVRDM